MKANKIVLALGMAGLVSLTGCGGDSGGSSAPTPAATYSVKAIDGYLRNAKVWLDINRNNQLDDDEPSAMSGEGGVAKLDVSDVPDFETYPVFVQAIANQTIDEDSISNSAPDGTPVTVGYMMSAPAGEAEVTPLSTLVNLHMVQSNLDLTDPAEAEQAKQEAVRVVAGQLGVEEEDLLGDIVEKGSEEVLYAAQSLVASGAVLPETPEEMEQLVDEVESDPESFNQTSEAVNDVIREVIDETPPDELETTPPPISEQDDLETDEDQDGVPDLLDAFPNDANEYLDSDKDGVGNNADSNDDSTPDPDNEGQFIDDAFVDTVDLYPTDPNRAGDHDNDGVDSLLDADDDNDGFPDVATNELPADTFPLNSTKSGDFDSDEVDNLQDLDDDGDGFADTDDLFPYDASQAGDHDEDGQDSLVDLDDDNDGIEDEQDDYSLDNTRSGDHDEDGQDNLVDDDDDNDGISDSADLHPFDDSKAGDPDNDGIDTLVDAYPNDGTKSVADQTTSNSAYIATLNINHREVMMLNVNVEKLVETFNDSSVQTTITTTYTTADNQVYGQTESVDIESSGSFTRIEEFSYDFNLDGDAQFIGTTLDIGTRTNESEDYWRYVDESDASPEGGVNGDTPRTFDNLDFSSREHLTDLTGIDTIQHFAVAISEVNEATRYTTDFTQYVVNGFVVTDQSTQVKEYASENITTEKDLLRMSVEDKQDWGADGSVNTSLYLETGAEGAYTFYYERPVWATPTDGINEEYADFNFTPGNWDNLTSYWNVYGREVRADGDVEEGGMRFVLDDDNTMKVGSTSSLTEYLKYRFHEWSVLTHTIDDNEETQQIRWAHYPVEGYSFTAPTEDKGQAYRVNQKQPNGLWVTYSFDEWGSADIENLADLVEAERTAGTPLDQIRIDGLSRSGAVLPHASFQYDEQGNPVQWYAVTQEARLTDGTPTLVELTLTPDGVIPGAYVMNVGTDMILVAPMVENPGSWYTDYYRQGLNTYAMDLDATAFSWTTDLGQLFTDRASAESRLTEVLNPEYRVCSSENTGELSGNVDGYYDFIGAAYNCGYIGIDASYLDGLTIYYPETEENYFSYQFNSDGTGSYYESADGFNPTFNWNITEHGVIRIENSGDTEYFAFIASEENKYSLLGFFEWHESDVPYSEIHGMEFTTTQPNSGPDYRVCTIGDTEWDEVNDQPASSPDYSEYAQAVVDCGGNITFTEDMVIGLEWHDYNADTGRHKVLKFEASGVVTKTKNGVVSGTYSWVIDENGFLKIIYDPSAPEDFQIFALIAQQGDMYSVKTLDSYLEDGQSEYWSEIISEEFTTTNPVPQTALSRCVIDESITSKTNATHTDFEQAIAQCGGAVDLSGATYGENLQGSNYVRINSGGETRGYYFTADSDSSTSGRYHSLKNGLDKGDFSRDWTFTDGYLILTEGDAEYSERLTLANLDYLEATATSSAQSSFVVFEEVIENGLVAEAYVWSFIFREYEQNMTLEPCRTGDSTWSDEKDQPTDFATMSEFVSSVNSCQVTTDNRQLHFTEEMLTHEGEVSTRWVLWGDELLTFNPDYSGSWLEPNEPEYSYSWSINADGYLVLDFGINGSEIFALTESNGLGYSVKGYWQPSDYDQAGWTDPRPSEAGLGEIWSETLSLKEIIEP